MIINNSHKFIFVHVPKTAGSSVTDYLSRFTGWNDIEVGATAYGVEIEKPYRKRFGLHKHVGAEKIKKVVGDSVWDEYWKFCFVRHPLDRLVSAYHFYRQWNHPIADPVRKCKSFDEFLLSDFYKKDREMPWRPTGLQSKLLQVLGTQAVDFVGRFENLDDDIAKVAHRLGLPAPKLPRVNASRRGAYGDYYSEESRRVALEFYAADFDSFGYERGL